MANWAWPHTPASSMARIVLADGPGVREEVGFLPEGVPAPAQIVWAGWFPWGPAAYLYEWHGERSIDLGRTDALIYRATGRRLSPADIPPMVGEDAETWAAGAALLVALVDVPAELIWPGL